jgi:uncharacterized protein with HEPN domain
MLRSPLDYIRHILDEAEYLTSRACLLTKDEFSRDETLKRAFVRSLEVIGEAAKKVPPEFRSRYASIEWQAMAGMRDRLIHDYFGVDYDIVWDVATSKTSPPARRRHQQDEGAATGTSTNLGAGISRVTRSPNRVE